ncbi:MAG: DUF438 domain-containing protein [Dehalococcoidia bacterium]|nr:DUF438 domain-containing protein [Dehalococcoidia bacterium]
MIEHLTGEQLERVLESLPLDISFVDANDKLKYWNRHETRVFKRPYSALNTPVQKCHPERSVDKVERIIEDFKAGKRDMAEFWIDMRGMKLYIRYFPVRSATGEYLGTLEVAQEVSRIRELEGQKRLLDE